MAKLGFNWEDILFGIVGSSTFVILLHMFTSFH